MSSGTREIKWGIVAATLTLVLVGAFQNCAPALPDNEVRQLGGASVRPTPLPSATPLPSLGDTIYGGLPWEGTCTNDFNTENMAVPGLDVPFAPLLVFNRASDGAAALWNFNSQRVQRGVVCKMNSTGWTLKATGDFNGDSNPDVLWRHTDGRTAVWLLRGSTRVNGGFSTNQAPTWNLEATADFDGDGRQDIFWRNNNNQLQIWYMNGATATSGPIIDQNGAANNIPAGWKLLGVGDFNLDRKADFLWQETSTSRLRIWLMNGRTITSNVAPSQEIVTGYTFLGIGDWDLDGKSDIAWKTGANVLTHWKMDGATRVESQVATLDANWNVEFATDTDGDFRSDLVFTFPNPAAGMPNHGILRSPVTPSSATTYAYPIRAGYTAFKFDRY